MLHNYGSKCYVIICIGTTVLSVWLSRLQKTPTICVDIVDIMNSFEGDVSSINIGFTYFV